ncbi:MAG: hypothetical protein SGPRY_000935 [Prymnesium sp.]
MGWRLALSLLAPCCVRSEQAVGLHDFRARASDELSFRKGERLLILALSVQGEDGWGVARNADGREGLLPLNYVRVSTEEQSTRTPPEHAGEMPETAALEAAVLAAVEDRLSLATTFTSEKHAAPLRAYRLRRARYNGPSDPIRRWGVALLPIEDSQHASGSPSDTANGQHRSGIGGVPFFNLLPYIEESKLSRVLLRSLREEWLPECTGYDANGELAGLAQALQEAATADRRVVLTFANLGYADFVLNGFKREVVPHTLVIALDEEAHALFLKSGLHSYFDERMPRVSTTPAEHRTAGFMDIMKLRLLYLAEVLALGYSALLTDADAVFLSSPLSLFSSKADLVVACDATVVPLNWRESPGMVMAGEHIRVLF